MKPHFRSPCVPPADPCVAGGAYCPNSAPWGALIRLDSCCLAKAPDCEKGARALQPYIVGTATTDANGHAQPAALPAGRYWVFGDAKVGDKRLMWHELVDLKGDRSVTLDLRNAMPIE